MPAVPLLAGPSSLFMPLSPMGGRHSTSLLSDACPSSEALTEGHLFLGTEALEVESPVGGETDVHAEPL